MVNEGELKTLSELEITKIDLNIQKSSEQKDVYLVSNFNDKNKIADINFNVDSLKARHESLNLSKDELLEPNLKGFGFLRDLNEALTLSLNLKNIMDEYKTANTRSEQIKILPNLINEWAQTSVNFKNDYELKEATFINDDSARSEIINLFNELSKDTSKSDEILPKIKSLTTSVIDKRFKDYDNLIDGFKANANSLPEYLVSSRNIRVRPSELKELGLKDENLLNEFENVKYKLGVIDQFMGKYKFIYLYIN